MTADPTPPTLKAAAKNALLGALQEDAQATAHAIQTILIGGPAWMHAALCGFAAPLLASTDTKDGAWWGIEVTEIATDKPVGIDDTEIPLAERDALRVAACYGNRDNDTIAAIVQATWAAGPEQVADLMVASVRLAANALKAQAGTP